jgi:hypothetical protein
VKELAGQRIECTFPLREALEARERATESATASGNSHPPPRPDAGTHCLAEAVPTHQANRLPSILSLARVRRIANSAGQSLLNQVKEFGLALVAGEEVHVGEGEGSLLVAEGLELL